MAEREQVLQGFNTTEAEYPRDALIHELFEAQVEKTPEAVAVVYEDEQLTYAELNARSNQLAHRLREEGVGPDVLVAISAERSLEMVVGLLGILKAGGAYVPVDPEYPQDRIAYMLSDSAAPVLLTQQRLVQRLPSTAARTLLLDEEKTYAEQLQTNLDRQTGGSYVEEPGVHDLHVGFDGLAQGRDGRASRSLQPGTGPGKYLCRLMIRAGYCSFASLSFDACAWELVMALSHGAQLHLGSSEELMPGVPLCGLLEDRGITHVTLPPAALGVMENVPALEACRSWWLPERPVRSERPGHGAREGVSSMLMVRRRRRFARRCR